MASRVPKTYAAAGAARGAAWTLSSGQASRAAGVTATRVLAQPKAALVAVFFHLRSDPWPACFACWRGGTARREKRSGVRNILCSLVKGNEWSLISTEVQLLLLHASRVAPDAVRHRHPSTSRCRRLTARRPVTAHRSSRTHQPGRRQQCRPSHHGPRPQENKRTMMRQHCLKIIMNRIIPPVLVPCGRDLVVLCRITARASRKSSLGLAVPRDARLGSQWALRGGNWFYWMFRERVACSFDQAGVYACARCLI
ncbi:hypothetical protein O3P69_013985 [Scylla paramamosain]|uniref:Uncharacterized protein n=1 Tax=Scylla paramamosain TaxID=85552 RepID=A0AAW0SSQ3_SCYPA